MRLAQARPSRWLCRLSFIAISSGHAVCNSGRRVVPMGLLVLPLATSTSASPSPRCWERSCRRRRSRSFYGAAPSSRRSRVSSPSLTIAVSKTVCAASRQAGRSCLSASLSRNRAVYGSLRGPFRAFSRFSGSGLRGACRARGAAAAV